MLPQVFHSLLPIFPGMQVISQIALYLFWTLYIWKNTFAHHKGGGERLSMVLNFPFFIGVR
jgi:hypothetical protein